MPVPVLPKPVQQLVEAFARLPGIGPKSASRLTYYLLRSPDEEALALADALRDLKAKTRFCQVCFSLTKSSFQGSRIYCEERVTFLNLLARGKVYSYLDDGAVNHCHLESPHT